ncbi:MAG: MBL fold metallo-hydrolase [Anaerolineae bacterium]|nr:MBL fold metallo-hydrolase [Thermoflexales bacterium]MDW8395026.1 MBL fold metallo-hydrolase [Anaerolineae bacterium]
MKPVEVFPGLYLLPDPLVNLFLIAEADGLTLIDAGRSGSAAGVLRAIQALGRSPADLKRILITHADPDHCGGANALRAATGARVLASPVEAEAMAQGKPSRAFRGSLPVRAAFQVALALLMPTRPTPADQIVQPGEAIPVWGGMRVLATPGHTPGHVSYFAPAHGVLFAGDSMTVRGNVLTVVGGPVVWDEARAVQSACEQLALEPRWILVGHGAPARAPFALDPRLKT